MAMAPSSAAGDSGLPANGEVTQGNPMELTIFRYGASNSSIARKPAVSSKRRCGGSFFAAISSASLGNPSGLEPFEFFEANQFGDFMVDSAGRIVQAGVCGVDRDARVQSFGDTPLLIRHVADLT